MEIRDGVLLSVSSYDIGENGEFTVPEGVTEIGMYAFSDCSSLTSVIIPEGVKKIGESAFWGRENLTSVTIPDSVMEIGACAFYNCSSLMSVVIPEGVTKIGDGAFAWCKSLRSVNIPNSATEICGWVFADCETLTSIVLPERVKTVGSSAFRNCTGLASVTFAGNSNCTFIGGGAFFHCSILKSKPANYKAFHIKDGELRCLKKKYREGVKHSVRGELKLNENGIHYCTNLFEIFNFYSGEIDKDIAIYEIEVGDKVLTSNSSKCCTNSCRLKKRLSAKDIIKILNGEAE